ncbi:hypothetical protein K5I29_04155 [Flavobacterium agricola]|uniref:Terminase small subunit n=1 Tax=Flavobacterium agricola TaxID=2870839 RepID=A0ABY6M0Z2_9FLAO|nr:hypothetical protein [Flavobacterium agricola]UYW02101.1 hypothetical protein K5I29_04155 [Flavobacterium agricola]
MAKETTKKIPAKKTTTKAKPKVEKAATRKIGKPVQWTVDKKAKAIEIILHEIAENGKSTRAILTNADRNILPSNVTFCEWLANDEDLAKQYARACELRAEFLLDEALDIVDDTSNDFVKTDLGDGVVVEKLNPENIQRSRLRFDARKWMIGKLNPKKYGDKISHTIDSKSEVLIETPEEREKRIQELLVKMGK